MVKFKVITVMIFSSIIGMLLVPTHYLCLTKIITGLAGISLSACGSAVLNHLHDQDEDKKMRRTQHRPLVTAKITPKNAYIFALTTVTTSTGILWRYNNPLCAMLTLATTFGYSIVYTRWLKPSTPQNIVIGGLSGAMPPLLGWSSLTNQIDCEPLVLVLIIFTWTPAHFWPLAIHHSNDYAKTRWPMLPITHGVLYTKFSIIAYTILTMCCSLLPFCISMAGKIYLLVTLIANARWLYLCYKLWRQTQYAMHLFTYSIHYLLVIFSTLVIDHSILRSYYTV